MGNPSNVSINRWLHVPHREKQRLLAEIKPGQAVELPEIQNGMWPDTMIRTCKARLVSLALGARIDPKCCYLTKSQAEELAK